MSVHGSVLVVADDYAGDTLAADTVGSDTSISVEDASAFREDGGSAEFIDEDGTVLEAFDYTEADWENDTVTIDGTLSATTYTEGTEIRLVPYDLGVFASIQPDDPDIEPIRARVPFAMRAQLPLGERSSIVGDDDSTARPPEEVITELVRGDWIVTDLVNTEPEIDADKIIGTIEVSDGNPPASSPTPSVTGGPQFIYARWTATDNADPLWYNVYISTTDDFTPGPSNFWGSTPATFAFIKALADDTPLQGGTTYYVKLVSEDVDGAAAAGTQGSDTTSTLPTDFLESDGSAPSSSPTPVLDGSFGILVARWDPVANADLVSYEVHLSTSSGFTPSGGTLAGTTTGTTFVFGTEPDDTPLESATTYYCKIIAKDVDGAAAAGAQDSAVITDIPTPTTADVDPDGSPPASSPTPTIDGSLGILVAKWDPVANNDFVTYEVHLSTSSGFTPSGSTLAGQTPGTTFVFRTEADDTPLVYATTYYCKIVAKDTDGSASASAQDSTTLAQVDTPDIAANAITANEIAADTITATQIAAGTITATEIAAATITTDEIAANTIVAGNIAAATITGTEIAATTITAGNIAGNTITAAEIAAGTITTTEIATDTITATNIAADTITSSELAADSVTANEIAAGSIVAGSAIIADAAIGSAQISDLDVTKLTGDEITANLIISGSFKTASTGQRVEFDGEGIRLISDVEDIIVDLPTEDGGTATFNGNVAAQYITITDGEIAGNMDITRNSVVTLQLNQQDPAVEPAVTDVLNTYPLDTDYGITSQAVALYWDSTLSHFFVVYDGSYDGIPRVVEYDSSWAFVSDHQLSYTDLQSEEPRGMARGTGGFYIVTNGYFIRYNTSWVFQNAYANGDISSGGVPRGNGDGTNTLWTADRDGGSGTTYKFRTYDLSGGGAPSLSSTITGTGTGMSGGIRAFAGIGNFDYGATRVIASSLFFSGFTHMNGSGTVQPFEYFEGGTSPSTTDTALCWDGTRFWSLKTNTSYAYEYSQNTWTSESSKLWNAYTWYDGTGTTHETASSPLVSKTATWKRRFRQVTCPEIPDYGDPDDADRVRIYQGRGSTEPANAAMYLQETTASGVRSALLDDITYSGTNPPASSDFPGGSGGATIESAVFVEGVVDTNAQEGWRLSATGDSFGFHPDVQVFESTSGTTSGASPTNNAQDGPFTWYKPLGGGHTLVDIIMIGAGGGGGGGRRSSGANASRGGGGGAGADILITTIPIAAFADEEDVYVGRGGGGGAGKSANNDGTNGGNGGNTQISATNLPTIAFLRAEGSDGGTGGGQGSGGGGGIVGLPQTSSFGALRGGTGGSCGGGSGSPGDTTGGIGGGLAERGGCPGGGSGGGWNGSALFSAEDGGDCYQLTGGAAGIGGIAPGPGDDGGTADGQDSIAWPGSGGGGSGARNNDVAQTGGDGGLFGAGGGGGGAAANGTSAVSGTGGKGAKGIAVIIAR